MSEYGSDSFPLTLDVLSAVLWLVSVIHNLFIKKLLIIILIKCNICKKAHIRFINRNSAQITDRHVSVDL